MNISRLSEIRFSSMLYNHSCQGIEPLKKRPKTERRNTYFCHNAHLVASNLPALNRVFPFQWTLHWLFCWRNACEQFLVKHWNDTSGSTLIKKNRFLYRATWSPCSRHRVTSLLENQETFESSNMIGSPCSRSHVTRPGWGSSSYLRTWRGTWLSLGHFLAAKSHRFYR